MQVIILLRSAASTFITSAVSRGTRRRRNSSSIGVSCLTIIKDAFEKEEFDLVLVDIQTPVMDGLKATEAMRAIERQKARARTPILALTADALLGDAERSRAAGCDGHLSKPISKEQLITAIENVRFVAQAQS
jgi:CheY-like chemotaxis protein